MKKQLLTLLAFFVFHFASAFTINSPGDFDICTGGGISLSNSNGIILGNLLPDDYTITFHWSQADADADVNAVEDIFIPTVNTLVFVRVEENANPTNFETTSFLINVVAPAPVSEESFTVCDDNGDGFALIDLGSVAEQIWFNSQTNQGTLNISFYETYQDATNLFNPLNWSGYFNIMPFQQTLYVYSESTITGCGQITPVNVSISQCSNPCPAPVAVTVSMVTQTSAVLNWTTPGSATSWEVVVLPTGSQPPTGSVPGAVVSTNPYVVTGLVCGASYSAYVKSVCSATESSGWTGPFNFVTPCIPQAGQPSNLMMCSDTGMACFDMTTNTPVILNALNPSEYTVGYYQSQADATNETNPIATPSSYCIMGSMASEIIFVRLENIITSEYQILTFALTVQLTAAGNLLTTMVQCDDDDNGNVTFDLTSAAAQLNTTNPLSYFEDSIDASNNVNAIANPTAFTVSSVPSLYTSVFIRENVSGGCDLIHTLPINALSNCNLASACGAANSLCGSLGVPFSNTVNQSAAEVGNDYGCLMSQPNPTWFHLPISVSGTLAYSISQQLVNGGPGIDVDFICYGPFSSPTAPCLGQLTAANTIACSFSTAAVESFTIPNAVSGQFYILMVTNFANQPGTITITQTNEGQPNSGDIDCTGLKLTAFLDGNSNGVKDSGEANFPLGQFHYERNNNGNVHNITSPTGTYSIYDVNPANSYDVSFTVDAAYAANYSVTPSSYANLSIVPGSGMVPYDFPVTVVQNYSDLEITIIPSEAPRPGFNYTNIVKYTNHGSQTVSGTVSYAKDPLVSIVNVSEAGAVSNATGFTYAFTGLQPYESREISVTMLVPTIPTVLIGDVLFNSANIIPVAGDIVPENNETISAQTIIGSYDPNDKMETHGRFIVIDDFGANDYLYYTIRFENSGTAAAENVKIIDVLDDMLDATTVRMVDASHEYVLDRIGTQLTWNFEDINLPYATSNPEGAKGFVHFKVKPKPGFAIGDIIANTASIFFDFNPAIVTNTFYTEFTPALSTPHFNEGVFVMYPNPAGDNITVSLSQNSGSIASVAIYDMLGKQILVKKSSIASETIDVSGISSGIYFLEVTTADNQKATKKLVIK